MNPALIIFLKELKDITRDRRTMITMIVIPLLLFPLLMTIATKFTQSQVKKAQDKTLTVGVITHDNAASFRESLRNREDLTVREDIAEQDIETLIKSDSLDAVIAFGEDFDQKVSDLKSGDVHLYFKSSKDMDMTRRRLTELIDGYENQLVTRRFERLYLDKSIHDAIHTQRHDVTSEQEKFAKTIGGLVPYLFILFYGQHVSRY